MYTSRFYAVMVQPVEIKQTRKVELSPEHGIDEIEKVSKQLQEIVQRLTATTGGDEREAVNLMLAHALTCASNHYDLCMPTTMKVVNMVAERMLGQANGVGSKH